NQNYTESDDIGHSAGLDSESSQIVTWYTLANQFSYKVDWLCTSTTVPCKATNLSATSVSSSQINLNWTAPSNEGGSPVTGYEIDRTVIDPDGVYRHPIVPIVSNTNSTVTAYSDTGLSQNTQYAYWVRAINSFGISRSSDGSHTTTFSGTTTPSPPTGLTATGALLKINLSWTAPGDNGGSPITGYMIERSNNGGSTWSTLVADTGNTGTTYSDTHVLPLKTYTYRVSAINDVGVGSPSNTSTASILSVSVPSKLTLP
ncbi:MAG TPA: fibronectin type III domain-containing protein, partial [Candidatus Nitrosotalea sp.]|nr:fibronectin type III domain-containing protein [Candidatus Nitrosotalea sp.]